MPTHPEDRSGWDPDDYDDDHAFVYEYGADLLDLLDPAPGERVLDLGCGTGHLTRKVADAGAAVVGIDSSSEMVGRARQEYPGLDFLCADARALPFSTAFDAVLSNAVLHWIDDGDQDAAIGSIHEALRPGGRLVAELGGAGNVGAITEATLAELRERGHGATHPWYFPDLGEYAARLEAGGFEVTYARLFDRATELDGEEGLRNWLSMFGDSLLCGLREEEREAVVAAIEDRLRPDLFYGDRWIAGYRRLRVVARRR